VAATIVQKVFQPGDLVYWHDGKILHPGIVVATLYSLKSMECVAYRVMLRDNVLMVCKWASVWEAPWHVGLSAYRVVFNCLDCGCEWYGDDLAEEPYGTEEDICPNCKQIVSAWDWFLVEPDEMTI
jgi:hypothetical protein